MSEFIASGLTFDQGRSKLNSFFSANTYTELIQTGNSLNQLLVNNNISGSTFYSGATDISDLFAPIGSIAGTNREAPYSGNVGTGAISTISGNNISNGSFSVTVNGEDNYSSGPKSFAGGFASRSSGNYSFAFGRLVSATSNGSFSLGKLNLASGSYSFAKGYNTVASGDVSSAEGEDTIASVDRAHAEGLNTLASNFQAHAEGANTVASGPSAHAEGEGSVASGRASHAGGKSTLASGNYSHAEGWFASATNIYAHSEGNSSLASGNASHAEGVSSIASGQHSHAEGTQTLSNQFSTHSEGFNTSATNQASHSEGKRTLASGYVSHSEGYLTVSKGNYSHSQGRETFAGGIHSHSEGYRTSATNDSSHAEGNEALASGQFSHAEGSITSASGAFSHSEGYNTLAQGLRSHAEGSSTFATGNYSHSEGLNTIASGSSSHAEGGGTVAGGTRSHAEGDQTRAVEDYSHSEGQGTIASGQSSHAEGTSTLAFGTHSHSEGFNTEALGDSSHAEGFNTTAATTNSHAEGNGTLASGNSSHAEGLNSIAKGVNSHAEGDGTHAEGQNSHSEGLSTHAEGWQSHAEGNNTLSSGYNSHAEGLNSHSEGSNSHAEGNNTLSKGPHSHAEGYQTSATGFASHSEGYETVASGNESHAQNEKTKSIGENSHSGGLLSNAHANLSFIHSDKSDVFATRAAILGGQYNRLTSNATNSVILGGELITGDTENTAYGINFNASQNISGNTFYSANTELGVIIKNIAIQNELNDLTRVQGGLNTYSGGNANFPTVNISGASLDNLYVSGDSISDSFSANTLSAGTIYSGGTDIEDLFLSQLGGIINGDLSITGDLITNSSSTISEISYLDFASGTTTPTNKVGRVYYNKDDKSLTYFPQDGSSDVMVNIGQESLIHIFNNTGAQINNGQACYISGEVANIPSVELANASSGYSSQVIGIATHDIPDQQDGFITSVGIVRLLDTSSFVDGDRLYLSDENDGEIINYVPTKINSNITRIGWVVKSDLTNGKILVDLKSESDITNVTDRQANILSTDNASTGIFDFSGLTINSIDNTEFDVSPIKGWIVDSSSNPLAPSLDYIDFPGLSGISTTNLSSQDTTHVLIDSGNNIIQQNNFPTNQQRRESIFLGKLIHVNRTNISTISNQPDIMLSPLSQARDIFKGLGFININNIISPNGTNLSINKSAGQLIAGGINWLDNKKNPHTKSLDPLSPASFRYNTETGTTGSFTSIINPSSYDVSGVVTPIPGSGNRSTNQRVYLYPSNVISIQYGQQYYDSLSEAIQQVQFEEYIVPNDLKENAILIGIISVSKSATDLSNTDQARFISVSKFGENLGGAAGLPTGNLQDAYNNSIEPEITTNATKTALTIKEGIGVGGNLIEGRDSGNNLRFYISSSGNTFYSSNISASTIYSGSTDIDSIIRNISNELEDVTRVGNGLNTYTAGTENFPYINISGASLDNLYVSGDNTANSFFANSLSGGTIYSGDTDIENIFGIKPFNNLGNVNNTYTWDLSTNPKLVITLTADTTITMTNPRNGGKYDLDIYQDSSGGHNISFTNSILVSGNGGGSVALTPASSSNDMLEIIYNGFDYKVNVNPNYT